MIKKLFKKIDKYLKIFYLISIMNPPFQNTELGKFLLQRKVEKEEKTYTHGHIRSALSGHREN